MKRIVCSLVTISCLAVAAAPPAVSAGRDPVLLYRMAVAAFARGDVERSVDAFDLVVEARPDEAPRLWERGIALYYVGRTDDCREQFEIHRRVNPDDAENAVWHYLCAAASLGEATARERLFPAADTRVPMMEIHALFAGDGSVEDVLAAVDRDDPDAPTRRVRSFYADLYLALWHEARGDAERTREHLRRALDGPSIGHTMETVARVHLDRLEGAAD